MLARFVTVLALVLLLVGFAPARANVRDLTELSLEELGSLEVTSMSRKSQPLHDATGAVFVLTEHDIRRSGVSTIPEALRLVPGVQVSQIDSSKWVVAIRGFASRLSRALLVMIDGRSVYTPLFAGVYWEVQDLFLDDIERIEVIRGPGGTLWGANAVNGVINIITKSAHQTRDGRLEAAAGNELDGLVAGRVGGALGERTSWRAYGKWVSMDGGFHSGTPEYDEWSKSQIGFRLDSDLRNGDVLSVHGDVYDGDVGQRVDIATYTAPFSATLFGDASLSGANIVARWSRSRGRKDSSLQSYFDRTRREELHFGEERNTFDLDWQQKLSGLPGGHELIWGAGYRVSAGTTDLVAPTVLFEPARRTEDVYSAFVQDEVSWAAGYRLVIGSKFEHNDYSGFEVQPSVRFAWMSQETDRTAWAAVSRAVRTPTRTDTDLSLTANLVPGAPTFARVLGSDDFEAEVVLAYEAGYRTRPFSWLLADVAVFYNEYDRLLSLETGPSFVEMDPPLPDRVIVPFVEDNLLEGDSYGLELSSRFEVRKNLRLTLNYTALVDDLRPKGGSTDTFSEAAEDASPRHQASLWSALDMGADFDLDAIVRFVDDLPGQDVSQYTELDLQVAWRPRTDLTVALVGRNLLHDHHAEFGSPAARVEIERSVLGRVTWTW